MRQPNVSATMSKVSIDLPSPISSCRISVRNAYIRMIWKKYENFIFGNAAMKENPKAANILTCKTLSIPLNMNQYSWFSSPGLRSI